MPIVCWMLMANSYLPDLLAYLALLFLLVVYLLKVSCAIPRSVYTSIIGSIVCLSIWLSWRIPVLWTECGETEWFLTDRGVRWGHILFPYLICTQNISYGKLCQDTDQSTPDEPGNLTKHKYRNWHLKLSLPVEEYSISYWNPN